MAKHIATVMRYVTVGSAEWFHAVILPCQRSYAQTWMHDNV